MNDLLPYGVVATAERGRRLAVLVHDQPVDLADLHDRGLLDETDPAILAASTLNPLIGAGRDAWATLRAQLGDVACRGAHEPSIVHDAAPVLPIGIGDYVDFYSSIEHATNLGRLFRPDSEPLLPNWRHLPIGYHGRAGTVVVSGTPIRRPHGQAKAPTDASPSFGPSRRLDIELELGAVLAAPPEGDLDPVDDPEACLFGLVVVNDWSARDIQAWEYQPLGPFLGKSFATTMSPWVVPWAALEPYRVPAPAQHPEPLPHLQVANRYSLDIGLSVEIKPAGSDRYEEISHTNAADLYWTFAQQIAHLTSNGATIRNGDLIATGTISGADPGTEGSFIELTRGGEQPLQLADGRTRTFLEDGDTIRLSGRLGERLGTPGPSIGACVGRVVA